MASPPRRPRQHRAAAPTSFAVPGSDDDYVPDSPQRDLAPRGSSAPRATATPAKSTHSSSSDDVPLMYRKRARAAAAVRQAAERNDEPAYESSDSDSSIPAAVSSKATAQPAEKASPAGKRGVPGEHTDSPAKKLRIILKNKSRSSDEASTSSSPTSPIEAAAASPSKEATPATSLAHSQPPPSREAGGPPSLTTVPREAAALHPAEAAGFQQVNQFLAHLRDNADAAQRSVQGFLDSQAMRAKITALEAQLAALSARGVGGDLPECQRALDASRARERELSTSFDTLTAQYREQKAYSDELRRDVGELSDMLEKFSDAPYEKVTDDEIEHEWLRLAHEIQNFALQLLTRDPRGVTAPAGANTVQVNALRVRRRQDPGLVGFYFQKHIWDRINGEVFLAGSNVWGGRSGRAFNRLCIDVTAGDAKDEMKNLSPMKAQIAKVLSSTHDEVNDAQVAKLVNGLRLDLHVFTDLEVTKSPDKAGAVERRLKRIVDRAMRLNRVFMTSRAFFLPMGVQDDYEDDDVDIRYTRGDPEEETRLEIQVSPQMVKFGDADGHSFDSCLIVCKAIVTMCEVKPRGGKRGRD